MKEVEVIEAGVEIIGTVASKTLFTMEVTEDSFKRNLVELYSYPEKTVVRELMANAVDAHAMADLADEPIDVFLPTSMDPTFIVRDYGVGMDHNFVMEMYSRVGYSTKRDTNKATGMFGVGSKSPLAIARSFTVKSFDKPGWNGAPHMVGDKDLNEIGRVRLYSVIWPAGAVPEINHTFDVIPRPEDQVERGGTEVKVPIPASIRSKIIDGLSSQHFSWFDRPIKFSGALDEAEGKFYTEIVELSPNLYAGIKPSDKKATNRYSSSEWTLFVRQGAAVYPIDRYALPDLPDDITMTVGKLCPLGYDLMVDVPIGTAKVTTAREAITYGEETVKNLTKEITTAFDSFAGKLRTLVGDAHSYAEAFNRILRDLYTKKEEQLNFRHQQIASALLPLMAGTIESNYKTYHDTLPDVPYIAPALDKNGAVITDANGKATTTTSMVRPLFYVPVTSVSLKIGDFPEGKVILVSGHVKANGVDSATLDTGNARSSISFEVPSVVYVIPSHLNNWKDRLNKHAKDVVAKRGGVGDVVYPGFPLQIIRCAKRNADAVVEMLKQRGVYTGHYGLEDLNMSDADILNVTSKNRSSSKTSVYAWDITGWSETKVEPDYDEPAYYIARVGIAHECYGRNPDLPYVGSQTPRGKYSNNDIADLIKTSRTLGIMDDTTPIYRVTEKQCETITKSNGSWMHLINTLGPRIETRIAGAPELAFMSSDMAGGVRGYTLGDRVRTAFGTLPDSSEYVKSVHNLLYRLCKEDELFLKALGAQYAWTKRSEWKIAVNSPDVIKRAATSCFGYAAAASDEKLVKRYNDLSSRFQIRYSPLFRVMDTFREQVEWQHVEYYLEGFLTNLSKTNTVDMTGLDLIDTLVKEFESQLDAVHQLL